jgi:hypothetical protein
VARSLTWTLDPKSFWHTTAHRHRARSMVFPPTISHITDLHQRCLFNCAHPVLEDTARRETPKGLAKALRSVVRATRSGLRDGDEDLHCGADRPVFASPVMSHCSAEGSLRP